MKGSVQNNYPNEELTELREKIYQTDQAILDLLVQRHHLATAIARIKHLKQIPVKQQIIWNKKCKKLTSEYSRKGLDSGFINVLLTLLHEESVHIQEKELKHKA